MHICLVYDVSNNRLRLRLSKACLRVGLLRLQKSVFVGAISAFDLAELEKEYRPLLPPTDRLAVIQLDKSDCLALLQNAANERLKEMARPHGDWYF